MKKSGGKKEGGSKSKTMNGSCSGVRVTNDMRSDVRKTPSHKNPYPKGLS